MSKKQTHPVFTKQQFLASEQFTGSQKDILSALLDDGKTYSNEQAVKMMKDFQTREVK